MKQTNLETHFGDLWCDRWIEQLNGLQFGFYERIGQRKIWAIIADETFLNCHEFMVLSKCGANFEQDYVANKIQLLRLMTIHDFYQHINNCFAIRYDNFWDSFWKQNGYCEIITFTNAERAFADEYIVSRIMRFIRF